MCQEANNKWIEGALHFMKPIGHEYGFFIQVMQVMWHVGRAIRFKITPIKESFTSFVVAMTYKLLTMRPCNNMIIHQQLYLFLNKGLNHWCLD